MKFTRPYSTKWVGSGHKTSFQADLVAMGTFEFTMTMKPPLQASGLDHIIYNMCPNLNSITKMSALYSLEDLTSI